MTRLELAQQLLSRSLRESFTAQGALNKLELYILIEAVSAPVTVAHIMQRTAASRTTVRRHIHALIGTHQALISQTTFKNQRGRRTTYTLTEAGKRIVTHHLS